MSETTCPACSARLTVGTKFCPACGRRLAVTVERESFPQVLAGRYTVLRALARGGMSAVYLAEDQRLGNAPVALKEMVLAQRPGDTDAFEAAVDLFRREAAILARLSHPNLPRVMDQFEEDGKQYLVMEYVDGETLRQRLNRMGLPPLEQALAWAEELCSVLGYLHRQNPQIIYRDLKPSNVMLRADGRLTLIDFGIARFYKPGATGDTASFGTLGYAPPEQYGQGQTDARTDVYALGVLLHHLLTGYDPASTPFRRPPLRQLRPDLPPALSEVIDRATSDDPAMRFESMEALRGALRTAVMPPIAPQHDQTVIVRRQAQQAAAAWPPPGAQAGRNRSPWPLAAAAVLVVLLLFGGVTALGLGPAASLLSSATTPTPALTATPAASSPTSAAAVSTRAGGQATETPGSTLGDPTRPPEPTERAMPPLSLKPSGVAASSVAPAAPDACGTINNYEPKNAVDSASSTAWRVEGDGSGEWLELSFSQPIEITSIGVIAGYDKVDPCDGTDRFYQGRVIKRLRLEFSGGQRLEAELGPQRDMQQIEVPAIVADRLRIVVLETSPPPPSDGRNLTAISEVEVWGLPAR